MSHITIIPCHTLDTPRLLLRQITPEVLHQLHTQYGDEEIKQFLHLTTDEQLAQQRHKFNNGLTMHDVSFRHFQMIERNTGHFLGKCDFHTWRMSIARAEIGYAIANDASKGRGYMKEALTTIIGHGFDAMGLRRIEVFTAPQNIPSNRLLKSLGFIPEGILREHYFKNGHAEDSTCYSLLSHEYQVLRHNGVFPD